MNSDHFIAVFDACADEVLHGMRSVDDCVAAYPDLEPWLGRALATVGDIRARTADPELEADPVARERLRACLAVTPQAPPGVAPARAFLEQLMEGLSRAIGRPCEPRHEPNS